MIEAPIDSITEAHLQQLLGRPENRRLDFKADLPDTKDKKKCNDMVADIVAFANSEGGDIVYGIEEEDGVAARIRSITRTLSLDEEIQRIYNRARDNIDVRLPAFHVHAVPLAAKPGESDHKASGEALVIRVPPSLLAPHRSTMNGTSRFMGRNSRGNFEMDTTELREAFGAAAAIPERLKALHDEMLSRCERIRLPFLPPKDDPRLIVTVVPLSVLRPNQDIEFARVDASIPVSPAGQFGHVHDTPSLEGYIMHRVHPREPHNPRSAISWAISHRKGYIDQGWSILDLGAADGKTISKDAVDKTLWAAVSGAVIKLKSYHVEGPWVIMATALGLKDKNVRLVEGYSSKPAWHDDAYLGQIMAETVEPATVEPMLSGFWRVFGLEHRPMDHLD